MMDMGDMMQQCMNLMNGMMGGGMMANSLWFVVLAVLLLVWLIGLAAIGGLGVWAYRRLRTH
jgi:hypothetical protein